MAARRAWRSRSTGSSRPPTSTRWWATLTRRCAGRRPRRRRRGAYRPVGGRAPLRAWLARRAGAARLRGEPVGWLPSKFVALSGVTISRRTLRTRIRGWCTGPAQWLAMAGRRGDRPPTTTRLRGSCRARRARRRRGAADGRAGAPRGRGCRRRRRCAPLRSTAAAKEKASGNAPRSQMCAASPTRLLRLLRLCAPTPLGAVAADRRAPRRRRRHRAGAVGARVCRRAEQGGRRRALGKGGHGKVRWRSWPGAAHRGGAESSASSAARLWRRRRRDL